MNFEEANSYLLSLGNEVSAMKLGLENIRTLLTTLGNPQNHYLKVQVAGTNGKGSVCAFLDAICISAGIKTGRFTSPHLISITERVKMDGRDISDGDFARHATRVRKVAENLAANDEIDAVPTFFEQVAAIALIAFAEAEVELAILETGLGGRLDATTAANAEIAAITRIDLDHQEYLGETIEEIAAEKAAIIHAATEAAVVGEQDTAAVNPIVEHCTHLGIEIIFPEFPATVSESGQTGFTDGVKSYDVDALGLAGRHQTENAWIAILLAECLQSHFTIADRDIERGLEDARHPGRIEYQGKFLFDGAHNIGGAMSLAAFLREYEARPITLVFGAMNDKDVAKILSILTPGAERIVVTEQSNSRASTNEELIAALPDIVPREAVFASDSVEKALTIAETITPEDGIILVTGSLYLVGEAKRILKSQI